MQLSVGAAIRDRRKARGWTQEQLGKKAGGVNKETVNRAEMGANVTVDTLLKLTRALDVELEISLRDPHGQAETVRDVLPTLTPSVTTPPHSAVAPGEDSVLSSLPSSPSHIALYGIIGELDPEQAKALRQPIEALIAQLLERESPRESPDTSVKRRHKS